ncbi:uncharacterized protein EV422DRAFT_529643 [Fimicolochytrium jonesii]|uniref:uncharacterized protein n=1 Tax=Fimicolochytrium jonesii TaxID=1396493 RepID=UPI0022FECB7B|nr:uncharacterized protein EV422DRAFT_529643 [Fimicolochytrium jonesii]KAI8820661.1 hypothetical protein EV422DRAFT_529643 [Fimicolochytrium jonesii]
MRWGRSNTTAADGRKAAKRGAAAAKTSVKTTTDNDSLPAVLRFAIVSPLLVFVDQALAYGEVSGFARTLYQLFCLVLLYVSLGDGALFEEWRKWRRRPGAKTIRVRGPSADPRNRAPLVSPPERAIADRGRIAEPVESLRRSEEPTEPYQPAEYSIPQTSSPVERERSTTDVPMIFPPRVSEKPLSAKSSYIPAPISRGPPSIPLPTPVEAIYVAERSPAKASTEQSPVAPVVEPIAFAEPPRTADAPIREPIPEAAIITEKEIPEARSDHVQRKPVIDNRSPLPPAFKDEIVMMIQTLLHLVNDEIQWTDSKQTHQQPVPCTLSVHKTIAEAWKFTLDVDVSSDDAFAFLSNSSTRSNWDPLTENLSVLRNYVAPQNGSTRVQHHVLKGVFPTIPRETVVLFHAQKLTGDRAVLIQRSVPWADDVPDVDGIKVETNICGTLIEQTGPSSCRITHIHDIDYRLAIHTPISQFMTTVVAPQAIRRLAETLIQHRDSQESATQDEGYEELETIFDSYSDSDPRNSRQLSPEPLAVAAERTPANVKANYRDSFASQLGISQAATDNRYAEDVEQMVQDVLRNRTTEIWTQKVSRAGTTVFQSAEGQFRFRVTADLQGTARTVFKTLVSLKDKPIWDPHCDSAKVIEELDANSCIYRLRTKQDREGSSDSMVLAHHRMLDPNRFVAVYWTFKKAGGGSLSAFFCEAHPRDATKCILTHLINGDDFEGSSTTVDFVAMRTLPAAMNNLRTLLAKHMRG